MVKWAWHPINLPKSIVTLFDTINNIFAESTEEQTPWAQHKITNLITMKVVPKFNTTKQLEIVLNSSVE